MSGIELKIRAFFPDDLMTESVSKTLNEVVAGLDVDFSVAAEKYNPDDLDVSFWSMSHTSCWKKCLHVFLYGKGDESDVCRVLETAGAVLISINAFNDQVGEYYDFGWKNGKSIKQRTVNTELKKLDPYLAYKDALTKGHVKKVRVYINEGVDISAEIDGLASLMHAATSGKENVIEVLLQAGADVNQLVGENRNALIYSLYKTYDNENNIEAMSVLLAHGADPNIISKNPFRFSIGLLKNAEQVTPLMLAATFSPKAVSLLIENGADVNLKNSQGYTALMFAIETYGDVSLPAVLLLLVAGADVNAYDSTGKCCLDFTSKTSEFDYILRKNGARYNPVEYENDPQIDIFKAIGIDDLDMVKKISKDVDLLTPVDRNGYKKWPLCDAISMRRYEILEYLISVSPDLSELDALLMKEDGYTNSLLQLAGEAGRVNAIKLLLESGVDPAILTKRGESALDFAMESKFPHYYSDLISIVKLLLNNGVPVGNSFIAAVESGSSEIVEVFESANAFDKIEDPEKVFHATIYNENLSFIQKHYSWMMDNGFSLENLNPAGHDKERELNFLVDASLLFITKGINIGDYPINKYCKNPLTATIMALAESGSVTNEKSILLIRLLDALLDAGAVPDDEIEEGEVTSIMRLQKKRGKEKIIQTLLDHGADINKMVYLEEGARFEVIVKDPHAFEGEANALMLAVINGHMDYVKYFIQCGVNIALAGSGPDSGTPLELAERYNRKTIAKYLREECEVNS